jgi:hypothetical protein
MSKSPVACRRGDTLVLFELDEEFFTMLTNQHHVIVIRSGLMYMILNTVSQTAHLRGKYRVLDDERKALCFPA